MRKTRLKNAKIKGTCSICSRNAELSYDHIPPKVCGNNLRCKVYSVINLCKSRKYQIKQGGSGICSICSNCNNILGYNYDFILGEYVKAIKRTGYGAIQTFDFDVLKIVKCIIGHMLASCSYDESIFQKDMRKFYNSDDKSVIKIFCEKYSLYCFPYPEKYKDVVFSVGEYFFVKNNEVIVNFSIYFYPCAFLLTNKNLYGQECDLTNTITTDKYTFNAPDEVTFKFDSSPFWPLYNNDSNYVVLGNASESAFISIK